MKKSRRIKAIICLLTAFATATLSFTSCSMPTGSEIEEPVDDDTSNDDTSNDDTSNDDTVYSINLTISADTTDSTTIYPYNGGTTTIDGVDFKLYYFKASDFNGKTCTLTNNTGGNIVISLNGSITDATISLENIRFVCGDILGESNITIKVDCEYTQEYVINGVTYTVYAQPSYPYDGDTKVSVLECNSIASTATVSVTPADSYVGINGDKDFASNSL
ncbi:MAG: hypothetical protein PQJ46_15115 [Spirochaetales bacterium]|nr:hypothetical protein [Spirochaetales bacterium]